MAAMRTTDTPDISLDDTLDYQQYAMSEGLGEWQMVEICNAESLIAPVADTLICCSSFSDLS